MWWLAKNISVMKLYALRLKCQFHAESFPPLTAHFVALLRDSVKIVFTPH